MGQSAPKGDTMALDPAWHGRPPESAAWAIETLHDGRLRMTIRHAPLRGVAPVMLDWWFRNIGGTMHWQGQVVPRYLVWHPRDHIHWALVRPASDGTVGPGAVFRIVEAFQANPRYKVDVQDRVLTLDTTGITLEGRRAGLRFTLLSHRFTDLGGATQYDSVLEVGASAPGVARPINRVVLPRLFAHDMGRAWIAHNIEEVGQFEVFLPALFASADK